MAWTVSSFAGFFCSKEGKLKICLAFIDDTHQKRRSGLQSIFSCVRAEIITVIHNSLRLPFSLSKINLSNSQNNQNKHYFHEDIMFHSAILVQDISCIKDLTNLYEVAAIEDIYLAYDQLKVEDYSIYSCIGVAGAQAGDEMTGERTYFVLC